jgi:hypothetical protein
MSVAGVRSYIEFHQLEPRKVGKFPRSFDIPEWARLAGPAVNVLYRSDKLNPTTGADEGVIDYIHDHKAGVNVYRADPDADGPDRRVPRYIRGVEGLWRLGDCLGFAYEAADGSKVEAKGKRPLPVLFAIPSGKALLVIQDQSKVLALIWGGRLTVEARGIVN